MNASRLRPWFASLLTAIVLGSSLAALAGENADEEARKKEEEAKRLAELQGRLLAADLVVRALVANVLPVGDQVLIVLGVRETFRGATARRAIYVETSKANAAGLEGREALWFLKATDDPRRFILDGPDAVLDVERTDEVTKALEAIEYASLDELKLTVSLNKDSYKLDEPIKLTWTVENPTDKPIVIAVPHVWGAGLAIGLMSVPEQPGPLDTGDINITQRVGDDTVLRLPPDSDAGRHGARFTFATLGGNSQEELGTASLLRLVRRYGEAEEHSSGSLLGPGRYMLVIAIDSRGAAEPDDALAPAEARLGRLQSDRILFDVGDERLDSLEDAKALVAQLAGLEDIEKALESEEPEIRARAIEAVRDYACPALLPLLAEMLRSDDAEARAAACSAVTMWARHPVIVAARPFEELLEKAPIGEDMSVIARAAADVAEAQQDATMIPLLLRYLYDENVNRVSKQSIALSIGAITGLELDETDLEEAAATIARWVKEHSESDAPAEDE